MMMSPELRSIGMSRESKEEVDRQTVNVAAKFGDVGYICNEIKALAMNRSGPKLLLTLKKYILISRLNFV